MNAEEKLLKIINNYGLNHQMRILNEEVFELTEACLCFSDEDDLFTLDDVTEEIADVMVMLEQFKLYYDISEEEVQKIMEEKIERQLERIAKGE